MRFLLDENISPLVAVSLNIQGYDVVHVRDVDLKGEPDKTIIEYAHQENRCIVTLDQDFADVRNYPSGTHAGIIRLKLKFAPSDIIVDVLSQLLPQLDLSLIQKGSLVISDGTTFRLRTP